MSWQGREAGVAAYPGKMHGRKSVQGLAVVRGKYGELTRGKLMRFDCNDTTTLLVTQFIQEAVQHCYTFAQ